MLDALPPWWKGPYGILKGSYDVNRTPKPSSWRSMRRGRSMAYESTPACPQPPRGVQGPRPLVGKGFSKGETTIGFAL